MSGFEIAFATVCVLGGLALIVCMIYTLAKWD